MCEYNSELDFCGEGGGSVRACMRASSRAFRNLEWTLPPDFPGIHRVTKQSAQNWLHLGGTEKTQANNKHLKHRNWHALGGRTDRDCRAGNNSTQTPSRRVSYTTSVLISRPPTPSPPPSFSPLLPLRTPPRPPPPRPGPKRHPHPTLHPSTPNALASDSTKGKELRYYLSLH